MLGLTILKLIIIAVTILSLLIVPENSTAFFTGIFIFSGSLINDYVNLIYTASGEKMKVQRTVGCVGFSVSVVYLLLSVAGFMNILKLVSDKDASMMLVPGMVPGSTVLLPEFSVPVHVIVWPLAVFLVLTFFELVFSFKRTDVRNRTTSNVGGAKSEC